MKRIVLALAAATLTLGAASAADMRAPVYKAPPMAQTIFNWTGFYIGANGGFGWARNSFSGISGTSDLQGGFGGGQVGYNWQTPQNWVFGIEADGDWSDIKHTDTVTVGAVTGSLTQKVDAFGTVRGRVGYAFGNVLPYFTGGWAWGRGTSTASLAFPGFAGSTSSTNDLSGFAIGGGVEWAFAQNWSAKVEYMHLDFSDKVYFNSVSANTDVDTVKFGVNYLFR